MTYRSNFALVSGLQLHYLEWGDPQRSPLLFLHANSHCAGVWEPVAQMLADTYRVLALDLRGHGQSEKPETGYSWAHLRDDFVRFVQGVDLRELTVIGHSRGGGMATLGVTALSERVSRAILYEPTLAIGRGWPQPVDAEAPVANPLSGRAERARRRRVLFPSHQALYEHWRSREAFQHWADEALWAYINHGSFVRKDSLVELLCPPWVEAQLYEELPRPDAWLGISNSQVPVLAVYGSLAAGRGYPERDPAAALRPIFPQCQVGIMADATHFGPMEQPELFAKLVRDFVPS